jgi:corrinoid protein of di/trimethylamine methyltransferase
MANLDELYEAILTGNLNLSVSTTQDAIAEGINPQRIINDYMVKAMEEIGARFESGKAFVPNLLMSARAMKGSLELLKPLLKSDGSQSAGKVVIGTVKGDLHDIGKNLVASMLEGCGFEVINLGVDVSSEKFIEAVKEHNADVICMSALLTTTMNYMKEVVAAVEAAGLKDKVKIMIGGAPLSQSFADQIGASGYSDNANSAVQLAKMLIAANL